MKNNSGRPRKVRHGIGGKTPRCGMCTWGRKDNHGRRGRQRVQQQMRRDLRDAA